MDLLEHRSFLREQVKNRMMKRAAELWGFSDTELDSFDPLVSLMMEACAVEFEKISAEINQTQSRLLDRLAQLMNPEIDVAKPAFGILQVQSIEAHATILHNAQFVFKKQTNERINNSVSNEIYFSPIRELPIFDAKIQYLASSDTLFSVENSTQKIVVADAEHKVVSANQHLWIGIEIDDSIKNLKDLYFYFEWQKQTDTESYYQHLPFSRWFLGDKELTKSVGLPNRIVEEIDLPNFETELNVVKKVEKELEYSFQHHFITIYDSNEKLGKEYFPAEFAHIFSQKELKNIKKPLLWLKIQFSHIVPIEAINNLVCQVNCVPVINRRLNKFSYKLQQNFNIIPLEMGGAFLGVKEIKNSNSEALRSIPLGNLLELDAATYTIQYGINRFDDRNAREMLRNMLETVRDESASFAALGEDFLSSIIRELNQTIARLEMKVDIDEIRQNPVPYLVIKQLKQGENVFIEYWTSSGELGNKIPVGSKLSVYSDSSVQKDKIYFMTSTQGGKDKLKVSEKINHYRKSLLSRNRIVTIEDVRALCVKELGESIQAVDVKKGFQVSSVPNMGFLRCIDVELRPSKSVNYANDEWQQCCEQLRLKLESQSVGNVPFRVKIKH